MIRMQSATFRRSLRARPSLALYRAFESGPLERRCILRSRRRKLGLGCVSGAVDSCLTSLTHSACTV